MKKIKLTESQLKEIIENTINEGNGRKPYIFGKSGLELTRFESEGTYWLTDEEFEKLEGMSEALANKHEVMKQKMELEMKRFKGIVQNIKKHGVDWKYNEKN